MSMSPATTRPPIQTIPIPQEIIEITEVASLDDMTIIDTFVEEDSVVLEVEDQEGDYSFVRIPIILANKIMREPCSTWEEG